MSHDHPLELSGDEMRRLVEAAMERIAKHVDTLPEQPASSTEGGLRLARSLAEPLPQSATPFPKLLDLLFDRAVPRSLNTAGPGYLAYVPGGGLLHSAVADLIADSVNRYVGLFVSAPGLGQIEANVLAWFREIVGYPPEAGGILTSGGSLSALTALITARRERLPENFLSGVLYWSDQVHHSLEKAALLAGFPAANLRKLPSDERFRLRVDALEAAVEEDRRRGLTPFLVVASGGTTNTGAVDPIEEIAETARRHDLWLHVDGAYGGFFLLTEEGRRVLRGIELADSVVLDPHKSLFLPYGTGALLVRDAGALRRTHSTTADYLPQSRDDPDQVDPSEMSPELTRPFRGLRVWLPLKMHGIGPFRVELEEKLALARQASEELKTIDGIEVVAEPQLSTLAFRLNLEGMETEDLNRLNRRLMKAVNDRQRVFLTGTKLGDRFVIRICVLSFRTHRDRMEMCLEDIREAVEEVRAS
ncbi:MAG TPA: aminotransferase class V-fold PLP-dependent enzyme [Thermoanaerobaculia bacterium]|jgi:aromatic-L-amino-acid decarboxylase|nr:aminotransferase class V-fold PLP-dependent enzyme [Thermoanaerobaculia bacterium]